MIIREALQSLTTYPVPVNQIDKICIDRGLDVTETYTATIAESEVFELATADVYFWMYGAPSLSEQDLGISVVERSNYLDMANTFYAKYDDSKFRGTSFGFIGEDWNA